MKYQSETIIPRFVKYANNDVLALQLLDEDGSPYGVVTVNLDCPVSDKNCSFIDTNNWGEDILSFLEKYNFGVQTGNMGESGFCVYPEFKFNAEIIAKYEVK